MTKLLKYAAYALAIAVVFTAFGALAGAAAPAAGAAAPAAGTGGGGSVFTTITDRMLVTFQNSRSVIFIVGGFGLIGLGFAAIFGKVQWKWLAALACGLAIVAVAGQVVDYVTRADVSARFQEAGGAGFGDTLDNTDSSYGDY